MKFFLTIFPEINLKICTLVSGGLGDAPYRPKCSQFHAVFQKNWQNRMLAPRLDGFLREILDPPFEVLQASVQNSQSNIVHKLMTQIHQFQDICA